MHACIPPSSTSCGGWEGQLARKFRRRRPGLPPIFFFAEPRAAIQIAYPDACDAFLQFAGFDMALQHAGLPADQPIVSLMERLIELSYTFDGTLEGTAIDVRWTARWNVRWNGMGRR